MNKYGIENREDVMKEHPILFKDFMARAISMGIKTQTRRPVKGDNRCSYKIGDILWMRESWRPVVSMEHQPAHIIYKANDPQPQLSKWKSPFFIPKWAARRLLITDVREQWLQDITEEEAIKEGAKIPCQWLPPKLQDCGWPGSGKDMFQLIWNWIYRDKPELQLAANPRVWTIEFRKM